MNFKHLRYFWTVAKAGGVVRASEQLHTTPQTLSGQINQIVDSATGRSFWCSARSVIADTASCPRVVIRIVATPCEHVVSRPGCAAEWSEHPM
jgi:hypothetical protein